MHALIVIAREARDEVAVLIARVATSLIGGAGTRGVRAAARKLYAGAVTAGLTRRARATRIGRAASWRHAHVAHATDLPRSGARARGEGVATQKWDTAATHAPVAIGVDVRT
jgi:hypothetical protein